MVLLTRLLAMFPVHLLASLLFFESAIFLSVRVWVVAVSSGCSSLFPWGPSYATIGPRSKSILLSFVLWCWGSRICKPHLSLVNSSLLESAARGHQQRVNIRRREEATPSVPLLSLSAPSLLSLHLLQLAHGSQPSRTPWIRLREPWPLIYFFGSLFL